MRFQITGVGADGPRSDTRTTASSAIVLAMKWVDTGVRNVLIAAPGERPQPLTAFQAGYAKSVRHS